MPFDLKITDGIIYVHCHGYLTIEDLQKMVNVAGQIEATSPVTPDRLIDLTHVSEIDITFAGMSDIAAVRRRAHLKNPVNSAIVAPKAALYGFARMFQTLNDNPSITVQLFRDLDSGLAWLKAGQPKTAHAPANAQA